MLAYDSGEFNPYGGFPIFQCGAMDANPSCKADGWSRGPFLNRGQYCQFEIRKLGESESCIAFEGYQGSKKVTFFDTCDKDYYNRWKDQTGKWEDFVDRVIGEKIAKRANGDKILDFVMNWPSGQVSFGSMEWQTMLSNGEVSEQDEEDISAMINTLSKLMAGAGGQCPTINWSETLPLTVYFLMIGFLTVLLVGRSVTIMGHRLVE